MIDLTIEAAPSQATAPAPAPNLPQLFYDTNAAAIDAEGIQIPQAFGRTRSGELHVFALAFDGPNAIHFAYRAMFKAILERDLAEIVFGWDRFTQPEQGTTLGDFLSVHHFQTAVGWRFGIMEYQHEPRIVKPLEWAHPFWSMVLRQETFRFFNAFAEIARKDAEAK